MDRDVIVIGGGMSGLIATARMAQRGLGVTLLEANHQVGGLLAGIRRKGFTFDAGAQSFASTGMVFPLLDQMGLYDPSQWVRAGHRIQVPEGSLQHDDVDTFLEDLAVLAPDQRPNLPKLGREIKRQMAMIEALTAPGRIPMLEVGWKARCLAALRSLPTLLYHGAGIIYRNLHGVTPLVARHVTDPQLVRLMCGCAYRDPSTFAWAGMWFGWFRDYSYPLGGLGHLMDRMADTTRALGAEIRCRAPVERILVSGGRARGVRLVGGEELEARTVLHTGDAALLYRELLRDADVHSAWGEKAQTMPASDPINCLYVGLDIPWEQLRKRISDHHLFFFPDKDFHRVDENLRRRDAHSRSWIQINCPGLANPGFAPEGQSCLVVQQFSSASWMDRWGTDGDDRARPDVYRELKQQVSDEMCEMAAAIVPEIRTHRVYTDLGTPMSTTRFTSNRDGSTVGWPFTARANPSGGPFVRLKTEIPGLFTSGHWYVHPGGVPFAALTGAMAADRIAKRHRV